MGIEEDSTKITASLARAKENLLDGTNVVLYNQKDKFIFGNQRGVKFLNAIYLEKQDLTNWVAADRVVGKAAASYFVTFGIVAVYAKVLSKTGKEVLEKYNVRYECEALVEYILNDSKTDLCPIEKLSLGKNSPAEVLEAVASFLATSLKKK